MEAIESPNFSEVGVMGDTHGNKSWVLMAIERFAQRGVTHILHLGDFGVWSGPEGDDYLQSVNRSLQDRGMIMVVTLGNHESYDRLESATDSELLEGFSALRGYPNLLFAGRGQHWNWAGVEFCSLGGANSIDRYSLTPHVDWWPQESISLGDVYRTAAGGKAQIMLTHDCPSGVPILDGSHRSEDQGWSPKALSYAEESRQMLRMAVDAVQPELLIHGHYHVHADYSLELGVLGTEESYRVRSVCLNKEHTDSNLALLEPATRKLTIF